VDDVLDLDGPDGAVDSALARTFGALAVVMAVLLSMVMVASRLGVFPQTCGGVLPTRTATCRTGDTAPAPVLPTLEVPPFALGPQNSP